MKNLDASVMQELLAPFQAAEIRIKNVPGQPAQPYVTARTVMTRLSEVLPFQHSFQLLEAREDANGTLIQKGRISILLPNGLTLPFEDVGSAPKDAGKGPAKQAKQAVSDCYKRCAVHIGPGRYLYALTDTKPTGIPEASLKKALAEVGYTGKYEKHHWGPIGGVRDLDSEDEEVGSAPAASLVPQPPVSQTNGAKINEEQKVKLRATVLGGGGNVESPMFAAWLKKNSSNEAEKSEDVLTEDFDSIIAKLIDIASKRAAKGGE